MKKLLSLFVLCLSCAGAQAAECLPNMQSGLWVGTDSCSVLTKNGQATQWFCVADLLNVDRSQYPQGYPVRRIRYVGLPSVLSKVGSRLSTITTSPDPLAALNSAPSRYSVESASDPKFAAIVADLEAKCGK